MAKSEKDIVSELNRMTPAARDAHLGQVVEDLLTNYNALQATFATLQSKYALLLAHLDTANVTGIGAANASTYGVTATSAVQIKTLSTR
jgi:hypothetical protein